MKITFTGTYKQYHIHMLYKAVERMRFEYRQDIEKKGKIEKEKITPDITMKITYGKFGEVKKIQFKKSKEE